MHACPRQKLISTEIYVNYTLCIYLGIQYNTLDCYNHPRCGGKWSNDLTCDSASIQEDQQILFCKDEICPFEVNGSNQLGMISTFVEIVQV